MATSTPDILQQLDPAAWRQHRFGLPVRRWQALAARCFWVTGAGTGFGRSIAVALAAAGAHVFLSGRRAEKLLECMEEMRRLGISDGAVPLPLDITDADAVSAAAAAIKRQQGSLYGLVNAAALPQPSAGSWPLMDMRMSQWEQLLRTNVTGQWLVTRAALPMMTEGAAGRVLFLTSEAGWAFTPGFGAYNLAKSALNNLGASFAAEVAARHPAADIQINVLVPGEARTEMNRGSSDSPYAVACMTLALLSHPPGGPNGCFFHRDGRHLAFAYAAPYAQSLFDADESASASNLRRRAFWPLRLRCRPRERPEE